MHILHKFVLIQLTHKCVKTTQSCVDKINTRICAVSQHECCIECTQRVTSRLNLRDSRKIYST